MTYSNKLKKIKSLDNLILFALYTVTSKYVYPHVTIPKYPLKMLCVLYLFLFDPPMTGA